MKGIDEYLRTAVDTVFRPGVRIPFTEHVIQADNYGLKGGILGTGGVLGAVGAYNLLKPEQPNPLINPGIVAQYPSAQGMPAQTMMYDSGTGGSFNVGLPVLSESDIGSQIKYYGKRIATDMATLRQLQEMQMALGVPV